MELYNMELKNELKEAILKNRGKLSENTLRTYTSSLNSLYTKLHGENGIKFFSDKDNVEKILKCIKELKSPQTRKTVLSALFILTKNEKYRENMMEDIKLVNDKYKSQKLIGTREETTISFDEVKKLHNEIERQAKLNPSHENLTNLLISYLCTGVLENLPPRRLELAKLKYRNYDEKKDNYVDFKRKLFVYNDYKTAKTYAQQTVEIPPVVMKIIKKLIKMNKTDYVLETEKGEPFSQPLISARISKLFDGNGISSLRSIFLSNFYKDLPKLQEMNQLAEGMGNSVNSALNYYVKK